MSKIRLPFCSTAFAVAFKWGGFFIDVQRGPKKFGLEYSDCEVDVILEDSLESELGAVWMGSSLTHTHTHIVTHSHT